MKKSRRMARAGPAKCRTGAGGSRPRHSALWPPATTWRCAVGRGGSDGVVAAGDNITRGQTRDDGAGVDGGVVGGVEDGVALKGDGRAVVVGQRDVKETSRAEGGVEAEGEEAEVEDVDVGV